MITARTKLGIAVLALATGLGTTVEAQTPSSMGFWQFSAGQVLAPYGDDAKTWRVMIGPSMVHQPEYQGSDNTQLKPGLLFNIRYRERLYLSTGEGLGYDVFRGRNHRIGASVTYDLGRDDDVDGLYGLGGIDPAVQLRLYGEYVFRPEFMGREFPLILSTQVYRAIGGYDGVNGDVGVYMPIAGSVKRRYFVFFGGSANFADNNTTDVYFGVSPSQSLASGLPVYNPEPGLRSVGTGINAGWFFADHWLFTGNVGAKVLWGDVADSPVVQEKWQVQGSIAIGYQF